MYRIIFTICFFIGVYACQNTSIQNQTDSSEGDEYLITSSRIGVAYKEDTDKVSAIMKEVGDEMLKDPEVGPKMIGSVDVWGVDQFGDSAVVIKVKITTKSGLQWAVSREYRRRIKKVFDARNIEIPFPHLSIYTGEVTKPMPIDIQNKK